MFLPKVLREEFFSLSTLSLAAASADECRSVSDGELLDIRAHIQQQRALGHDTFRAKVEAKTQRFADIQPARRPSRHK